MKITAIGCGHFKAKATSNGNNCFLLEDVDKLNSFDNQGVLFMGNKDRWEGNPRKMLIDCGRTLPETLERSGHTEKEITDIYISHQHSDHIGGLETFAYATYDFINKPQFAPEGATNLIANVTLVKDLWQKSARGGMESLEGIDCTLETFFRVKAVEPNQRFMWCGWECRLVQQIHIMSGSVIMPTFGLIMAKPGHKTIYFVTDSQHCSPHQLEVFYKEADLILQDCELVGVDTVAKEMKFCSHVHANYGQLAGYNKSNSTKLPAEIKKKMWLTHYQDFYNEDKDFFGNTAVWDALAEEDGFSGFVQVGQTWEV